MLDQKTSFWKFCSVISITTFLLFILVNNNSFAAPDAGTLLKQEKELITDNKLLKTRLDRLYEPEVRIFGSDQDRVMDVRVSTGSSDHNKNPKSLKRYNSEKRIVNLEIKDLKN